MWLAPPIRGRASLPPREDRLKDLPPWCAFCRGVYAGSLRIGDLIHPDSLCCPRLGRVVTPASLSPDPQCSRFGACRGTLPVGREWALIRAARLPAACSGSIHGTGAVHPPFELSPLGGASDGVRSGALKTSQPSRAVLRWSQVQGPARGTYRRTRASGAIAGAARGWWWGCPVSAGRWSRRGRGGRQVSQQRTKRSGGPVVADRSHQHPARKARNSGHQHQQALGVVWVAEQGRGHARTFTPSASTAARVVGRMNQSAGLPAWPGSPAIDAPKSASHPATASRSATA